MDLPTTLPLPDGRSAQMARKKSDPIAARRLTFARKFREAREDMGYSQTDLAALMGIPKQTVSAIEARGLVPSIAALAQASTALGVDFEKIIPPRGALKGRPSGIPYVPREIDPDSISGRVALLRARAGLSQV